MNSPWITVTVILSVACAVTAGPTGTAAAQAALRRGEPSDLSWTYSQRVDINCDGAQDHVFTAASTDGKHFYVGVVLGPISAKSQYSIVRFDAEGNYQSGFCGPFESLRPAALVDVSDALGGELPEGYRVSQKCKGLRLVAGECDNFHLYWNHSTRSRGGGFEPAA